MSTGHKIQERMKREREALVAKHRKQIEAEDKVKFAKEEKRVAEERRLVKDQVAARRRADEEREAAMARIEARKATEQGDKPKRERGQRGGGTTRRKIEDDGEFVSVMVEYLRKDAASTWQDVLAQMRAAGIAGGTNRTARLFSQAQAAAKSNGKSKGKK